MVYVHAPFCKLLNRIVQINSILLQLLRIYYGVIVTNLTFFVNPCLLPLTKPQCLCGFQNPSCFCKQTIFHLFQAEYLSKSKHQEFRLRSSCTNAQPLLRHILLAHHPPSRRVLIYSKFKEFFIETRNCDLSLFMSWNIS